jgi:predicted enzyme related to lactoylglutathione lyase
MKHAQEIEEHRKILGGIMKRVVHFEIYTDDPEAVQPFYQDVFGWTFKKFEGGPVEYWLVTTGEDKDAGIDGGLCVHAKVRVRAR